MAGELVLSPSASKSSKLNFPSVPWIIWSSKPSSPTVLISMLFLSSGQKASFTSALSAFIKVPCAKVLCSEIAISFSVTPIRLNDTSENVTSRCKYSEAYCWAMACSLAGGNMILSVTYAAINKTAHRTANIMAILNNFFIAKL